MLRPLPTLNATFWSGGLIAALGGLIMVQWWVRWPLLAASPLIGELRAHAGPMLLAAGIGLVARAWQHAHHRPRSRLADAAALVLIAYPLLTQVQSVFGISLGLDFVRGPVLPTPANPLPGRMAPNTALAFAGAGVALWLLRRAAAARQGLVKAVLAVPTALAFSALVGYLLGLEQLYRIASFNVMLLTTTLGLCLLSLSLWGLRAGLAAPGLREPQRLERHIAWRTFATLAVVALATGGAAFVVMRDNFAASLQADARTSAVTSALALENTLQTSFWFPRTLARRPALLQAIAASQAAPEAAQTQALLHQFTRGVLAAGLDGIRVHGPDGRMLAQAGDAPADAPAVAHRLVASGLVAELRWQGSHVLQAEVPVLDEHGRQVGHIVTQQRLWLFDQLLAALGEAGDTADAQVCSRRVTQIVCAPSRLQAMPGVQPMFDANGRPASAMGQALMGESGARVALDARGVRVVAGYAPLGELGLGLVVQGDASTLYAPLKQSLHLVGLVVAVLVGVGAWSLRLRVRPLLQAVVQEQRRTRTILETSSDAFIALGVDGRVTDWNQEAERLFGWSEREALGRPLGELIVPPAHRAAHDEGMARFVATGQGPVVNRRTEITGQHRDGHEIPIELSISAVATPEGYVANAFVRDIRARREAQQRLQDSERRLHDVLNNIPAMVGHFDAQQRCLFANDLALKSHGLTLELAVGRHLREGISPEAYALHEPHIAQVMANRPARFEGQELRRGVLMHYQTDLVPEIGADGQVRGFYVVASDVTEQKRAKTALEHHVAALKQAEARMAELALSDALTGLANRRRFDERLPEALARAARERRGLALMFIDVDHFKRINDGHGHAAGDAVLVEFGARLKAALRGTDFVARLAGDEFVVVLEGLRAADEAEQVADKLAEAMRRPMDAGGTALAVTTSIGIAYLPGGARCAPAALLALADQALYATKAAGRDGHSLRMHGAPAQAAA